jgi:hypothetical protein
MTLRLAVMASGRGSNFQAIQREIEAGHLDAEIALLLSDRKAAPALDIAKARGIPTLYLPYDKADRAALMPLRLPDAPTLCWPALCVFSPRILSTVLRVAS